MSDITTDALRRAALIPEYNPQVAAQRGGSRGSGEFKSPYPDNEYFGIPKAPEALQYTDQLAKDAQQYFQDRQRLESFAKTMWKNYGIDVTNPDASNPQAIVAAQTFQQELANLMFHIDRSKEGQKIYKDALAGYMGNTFGFGGQEGSQYASQLTPEQLGYSKEVDPVLKFAQANINATTDTTKDYNSRVQDAQAFQNAYANPTTPQDVIQQYAASSLGPKFNVQTTSGGSGKEAGVGDYVSRLINHKHGGGNWGVSKNYTEGGEVWRESKDYAGTKLGKRTVVGKDGKEQDLEAVVEKTVRNPQTGEVKWVFTNKSIPPESLNISSNQLLEMVSSNNPKYPTVEKVYEYVRTLPGVSDHQGNLIDDMWVSESTRKSTSARDQEAAQVPTTTSQITNDIATTKPFTLFGYGVPFTGGSKEYATPYGKVVISMNADETVTVTGPDGKDTEYNKEQLPAVLRAYQIDMKEVMGDIDSDI